jgi:hypothetical protein
MRKKLPDQVPAGPDHQPAFDRAAGETTRALAAFMAYFNLGQSRSPQGVADHLGEHLSTLKNWSAKFNWLGRPQAFNSGLLQQQRRLLKRPETFPVHSSMVSTLVGLSPFPPARSRSLRRRAKN